MSKRPRPIVLTVLDGWGYRAETKGNAIALARKPAYDELLRKFPNTLIQTSGPFVGLPEGQMGNSEVGHMNIGAGRIVHMDITRIDLMIANKQLQNVSLFQQAMERGEMAYRGLVHGEAETKMGDAVAALQRSYEQGVTDEFVKPMAVTKGDGAGAVPGGVIRSDDAVIFYNFRADRARQMTRALAEPGFDKFVDEKRPHNLFFVAMTQYEKTWPWLKYVLAPEKLEHILAQVFAELQYKNLRTAETEKYAHVTYFFNGGVEKPFGGEERILVPSPEVATYDLKPEMSAAGITDTVVKAIEKDEFDAIIMNYANADMVGHSGRLEAAIKAVEAVDAGLARIYQAMQPRGGAWIITADHGNAETMIDPSTGGPHTYHTTNPVPFILVTEDEKLRLKPGGALRDIAPTLLGVLGQKQPADMTGTDLRVLL